MGRTGGKYDPLREFLVRCKGPKWVLTFEEIEHLLKSELPRSAFHNPIWWANSGVSQSKAWLDAGWKVKHSTDAVRNQKVEFYKVKSANTSINIRQIFTHLNCTFSCDETQLKKAYEKMCKQYNVSILKDMGMGQELIELAEKKTKEINNMYDKALSYLRGEIDVQI